MTGLDEKANISDPIKRKITGLTFVYMFVLHEEPCTDPYARFCGQTEASASSDPMSILCSVRISSQPILLGTIVLYGLK